MIRFLFPCSVMAGYRCRPEERSEGKQALQGATMAPSVDRRRCCMSVKAIGWSFLRKPCAARKVASSISTFLWFFFFFLSVFGQSAAAAPDRLSVVYCVDCVPFHYQDENGEPAGLIIDHWRLWSEKWNSLTHHV